MRDDPCQTAETPDPPASLSFRGVTIDLTQMTGETCSGPHPSCEIYLKKHVTILVQQHKNYDPEFKAFKRAVADYGRWRNAKTKKERGHEG